MKFKTAFLAIFGVIILHAISLMTNVYGYWKDFDIPMHFLGGFVIGMLGIAIHHKITDKHHFKMPQWYHYLFVLSFVMLVGVAWEFHEYILDNTLVVWYNWTRTQPSIGDTMLDLLMDGVGAVVATSVFKKKL